MNPTAYHEAGHAVMALIVGRHITLSTIESDGKWLARTELEDTVEPPPDTPEWDRWNEDEIMVKCAGFVAEEKCVGSAICLPVRLAAHPGDESLYIARRKYPEPRTCNDYLYRMLARTKERIAQRWADVEAIAAAFEQHGRLGGAEIDRVLQPSWNRAK